MWTTARREAPRGFPSAAEELWRERAADAGGAIHFEGDPRSGTQLRRKYRDEVRRTLREDTSRWALFQRNPGQIVGEIDTVFDAVDRGTKAGTRKNKDWAFDHWARACAGLGTPALRNDPAAHSSDPIVLAAWGQREKLLMRRVLMSLALTVRGRDGAPKASTLKQIISQATSSLRDVGCRTLDTREIKEVLCDIVADQVRRLGIEVTLVRSAEPFSLKELRGLVRPLPKIQAAVLGAESRVTPRNGERVGVAHEAALRCSIATHSG